MKVWISARGTVGSSHQEPDLHKVPVKLISADLGDNCRLRSQSWAGTVSRWVSDCQWMNECFGTSFLWFVQLQSVFEAGRARPDSGAGLCASVSFAPVVPPELLLCVTVSMLNPLHLEAKHHFRHGSAAFLWSVWMKQTAALSWGAFNRMEEVSWEMKEDLLLFKLCSSSVTAHLI